MKITLFTSNNLRHNYLINLLSNCCEKLFVVQEQNPFLISKNTLNKNIPLIKKKYFENVDHAQKEIFGSKNKNINLKKTLVMSIMLGDLSKYSIKNLSQHLDSDLYIVFGSSFIKGELIDFLIKNKAINIHMGISPYYRGTDCNFWALYDNNPHLVGATIHLLSKGLDSGPILYHALSNIKTDPFVYTMSTVKSAFHSLKDRILNKSILNFKSIKQDRKKQIRYSKSIEFNERVIDEYFKKKIDLNSKKIDYSLLKEPFFLNK